MDAIRENRLPTATGLFRSVIAYGAGWADRERQQTVGDSARAEPRDADAITAAELERALDDPRPAARNRAAHDALGRVVRVRRGRGGAHERAGRRPHGRRLGEALPDGEVPLRVAVWTLMRPMLSPRLAALHADGFVADGAADTTVDLARHRGESTLNDLDLGDDEPASVGRRNQIGRFARTRATRPISLSAQTGCPERPAYAADPWPKGGMTAGPSACGRGPLRSVRETRGWRSWPELERRPLMAIVAGFDVHRAQITYDALDTQTGEIHRGRMRAEPEAVRAWVAEFAGARVEVAVEAWTGWLFVCEALAAAGAVAHLAEPAEASALRGSKRRAKTDRADARWLRTWLCERRLPQAWIPAAHVRGWRTRTRLRKTLVDERTGWVQRIQATLFDHGIANVRDQLLRANGRVFLRTLELPPAAAQRIEVALAIIDEIDRHAIAVERELARLARHQPGCQALMRQYGIGPPTATTILCELGDVSRLSASRKAVRCSGLDIGVHRCDRRSHVGRLSRHGSPQLRWALYEPAQSACKPASPDHVDYLALKARGFSHPRASMTIARKLARRRVHILRELGPDALAPVASQLSPDRRRGPTTR